MCLFVFIDVPPINYKRCEVFPKLLTLNEPEYYRPTDTEIYSKLMGNWDIKDNHVYPKLQENKGTYSANSAQKIKAQT